MKASQKLLRHSILVFCVFVSPVAISCDSYWDGDTLGARSLNSNLYSGVALDDVNGKRIAVLTNRQLSVFYEAKRRLSQGTGRDPRFILCPDMRPNAFARMGTTGEELGITLGMIQVINGDRDMAALVIGHELAHFTKNHLVWGSLQQTAFQILGVIVGTVIEAKLDRKYGVTGVGEQIGKVGALLVSRKFSRDIEREADEVAFAYMVQGGYNPEAAIRFSERLLQLGQRSSGLFLETHPGWEERADRFRNMIAKNAEAQQLARLQKQEQVTVAAKKEPSTSPAESVSVLATRSPPEILAFAKGVEALEKLEIENALKLLISSSDAGYPPAQATVGFIYMNGLGSIKKDDVKAVELFQLSAEKGNSYGQANLGFMYSSGRGGLAKDEQKAVKLYKLSAYQGNPQGQANLGLMYSLGLGGLPKDDVEAVTLFKLSANQGNAYGQTNLGTMYQSGRGGLPKDEVEAVRLYRLAANQGHSQGQANLGVMYAEGIGGLPKNDVEAVRLYQLSAHQGNSQGQSNLGVMYSTGRGGLERNDAEALRLFKLSAEKENALAEANLGTMYAAGTAGLKKDDVEAVRLFKLAAEKNNPEGQVNLGFMYATGSGGLAKNELEAVKLFQAAAVQGNAQAQANLGAMYEFGGGGLAVDLDQALSLYKKAHAQGNATATAHLRRLGKL